MCRIRPELKFRTRMGSDARAVGMAVFGNWLNQREGSTLGSMVPLFWAGLRIFLFPARNTVNTRKPQP